MAGRTAAIAAGNHYKDAKVAIIRPQESGELEKSAVNNKMIGSKPEHRAKPNKKEGV